MCKIEQGCWGCGFIFVDNVEWGCGIVFINNNIEQCGGIFHFGTNVGWGGGIFLLAQTLSRAAASSSSAPTLGRAAAYSLSALTLSKVAASSLVTSRGTRCQLQTLGGFVWDSPERMGIRDAACVSPIIGNLQMAEAHPQGYVRSIGNNAHTAWFNAN
jgi:hypothetical protein